jgi:hypothetical protein
MILALYAWCSVCPAPFLPSGKDQQRAGENRFHEDCNHGDTQSNGCFGLPSQYLNAAADKISPDFTVRVIMAAPQADSIDRNRAALPNTFLLSFSGPPGLFHMRLRI